MTAEGRHESPDWFLQGFDARIIATGRDRPSTDIQPFYKAANSTSDRPT